MAETILVVEDEPDILDLLIEHFEAEGYVVQAAKTGMEAIVKAKARPPDLVLLDIMMPGMNGFDVCNILRDFPETSATPIIFLTAISESPLRIMGMRLGATDYITKPFDLRELTARVAVAIGEARDQVASL